MKRIDIAWDLDEGLEDPHAVSAFDVTLEDDGSGATHTHKFHEFIYLLDGDAIQVYGDRQFPFTPGSLYFLPAGDWHIARSRTRARAVVLNFYDQAFAPSLPGDREGLAMVRALTEEARAGRPRVALSRNTATEVRGLLESAARECARHEPGWRSAVGIRLESLLLLLRRETALGRNIEVESTFSSLPLSHAERMRPAKMQAIERARPNATVRGYDGRWREARKRHLARHPLCEACAMSGRTEAATVVDHITPHRGDQRLFWDSENWQSLCRPCHNAKTMKESIRRARAG